MDEHERIRAMISALDAVDFIVAQIHAEMVADDFREEMKKWNRDGSRKQEGK